tara:strand:+ start:188 stop:457 length:270 start_codon:yes stop_codon:yes gene_type:complete
MNINFSELIKNTYVRAALVVAAIAIVFTLLGNGGEAGETVAQTNDPGVDQQLHTVSAGETTNNETTTEKEILEVVVEGNSNEEVAEEVE